MTGIQNKVDILLISETKLDETFPTKQFTSPYRLDRNGFGGWSTVKTELSNREGSFYRDKRKMKNGLLDALTILIMQRLVYI